MSSVLEVRCRKVDEARYEDDGPDDEGVDGGDEDAAGDDVLKQLDVGVELVAVEEVKEELEGGVRGLGDQDERDGEDDEDELDGRDAKERGVSALPYLIGLAVAGPASPLLYLLLRGNAEAPVRENGRLRAEQLA